MIGKNASRQASGLAFIVNEAEASFKEKTKTIVVISGKGGTGKTTLSSSLSLLSDNRIIIDCDVDAADLSILLKPELIKKTEFFGSKKAEINIDKCSRCSLCESLCRFEAIKDFYIDKISCEGCGLCYRACPENAISFEKSVTGYIYNTKLKDNSNFIYASLVPGEGNSGRLVTEIRKQAGYLIEKQNPEWNIMDGPPGIGCPVNASITGVDLCVIVTEPTKSGFHDLKRLIQLLTLFKVVSVLIINKYDLNIGISREIEFFSQANSIPVIGRIPFDINIIRKIQKREPVIDISSEAGREIHSIWKKIQYLLETNKEKIKMKIAITANGGSLDALVNERFGRCPYFVIVDSETMKFEAISNLGEQMQSGAGPKAAGLIASKNVEVLLTGRVGDKAEDALNKAGIKIITGLTENQKVKDAVEAYLSNLIIRGE